MDATIQGRVVTFNHSLVLNPAFVWQWMPNHDRYPKTVLQACGERTIFALWRLFQRLSVWRLSHINLR